MNILYVLIMILCLCLWCLWAIFYVQKRHILERINELLELDTDIFEGKLYWWYHVDKQELRIRDELEDVPEGYLPIAVTEDSQVIAYGKKSHELHGL